MSIETKEHLKDLLKVESPYLLYYKLNVVEVFLHPSSSEVKDNEWNKKFAEF